MPLLATLIMAIPRQETPFEAATRQVVEAEQRRARQLSLIADLTGQDQACARQVLTEIERTLTIARAFRAVLFSLEDDA